MIAKLKKLKKIQPDQARLDLMCEKLLERIDFEPEFSVWNWLREPQAAALIACIMLIIFGGPWLTIKASTASLPGEFLYNIKKASEGIQATVSFNDSRAQLQIEFASRRLKELSQITDDTATASDQKAEKAQQVLTSLKDSLDEAVVSVGGLSREKAIAAAAKTQKIREDLAKTKQGVITVSGSDQQAAAEIIQDLDEAQKVIEEIDSRILAVLSGNNGEGNSESATTTDQEIIEIEQELDGETETTTPPAELPKSDENE